MKHYRSLGVILGILGILSFQVSFASAASAGACDFGTKLDELKKLQAGLVRDDAQSVVNELNLRKDLLRMSIGCLKNQASELDDQLSSMKTSNSEVKAFVEWLHRQIEENISFYNYKETQINSLGLKGAKDLAKELSSRKIQNDDSLTDLISAILDWDTNQVLFQTGTKRFSDIRKTIGAFDLPSSTEIITLETQAAAIFNDAASENEDAWQSFTNRETDDGRAKTKESLEKLAKAYTVFLKISEVGKKTLPL